MTTLRTCNFETISLKIVGEDIKIVVKSPTSEWVEVNLMIDELMIFLTECGNAMEEAKGAESAAKIRRELERIRRCG